MIADTIKTHDGYTVEIHYDNDIENPLKEYDGQPTLVLHSKAEGHFGWSNDDEWYDRLNGALDSIAERGFTRKVHGERGALAVIARWMHAFYGVRVVVPVGAGEHSGTWTYLGDGSHWCDPGGWDSGWVGWLFATAEQTKEWGFEERTDEELLRSITNCFKEFSSWVSGDCYGYVVSDPEDKEIAACWGFYGSESYDERVESELPARLLLPGTVVKQPYGDTDIVSAVEREDGGGLRVEWEGQSPSVMASNDMVTVVAPGYMREQFMAEVEGDRADRARDEAEIAEMRLAEVGA